MMKLYINYIVSKENYNDIDAVNNLKNVCDPLGFGVYSKSETGNFSVDSFARIYSDAIIDLKTVPIAYTSTLNANSIPANVERNAFINSLPKSYDKTKVPEADADGNIDFKDAAVKVGAAQLDANGNLVFPSLYDACDVSESTRLGYEQYMMNQTVSDRLISGAIQIVPFSDKILYEDNDGDGIINKYDPNPEEHFGLSRDKKQILFKLANSIDDFEMPAYIDKIKETEEMHEYEVVYERHPELQMLTPHQRSQCLAMWYLLAGATWEGAYVVDLLLLGWDGVCGALNLIPNVHFLGNRNINNAAYMLLYYNSRIGGTLAFDAEDLVTDTVGGKQNFNNNIKKMKLAFENALSPGQEQIITTTKETKLPGWELSGGILDPNELDAWASLNQCSSVITAECSYDGTTYDATVYYYVVDRYDFYENNPKDGLENEVGLLPNDYYVILSYYDYVEPYDVIGYYKTNITWTKSS